MYNIHAPIETSCPEIHPDFLSLRSFEPEFCRPSPVTLSSLVQEQDDVIWIDPDQSPPVLWDYTMYVEETTRGSEVKALMEKAFIGPLKEAQQVIIPNTLIDLCEYTTADNQCVLMSYHPPRRNVSYLSCIVILN
jgi:hypothetical protein